MTTSSHDAAPSLSVDQAFRPGEEARQTASRALRLDIQLLRALAILLVIAHHARLPFVPGGFLGVDIFFVISGYLMTGLIDEGIDAGRFTFAGFYQRRARRLLPAAYATLVGCALAMPWIVDSKEYRDFVAQLAGSFAFVSNVVLWKQSDYFGSAATLKPLLHMWSLSIEEQFYIVLPALMVLTPSRWRAPLAAALVVASAALCFVMVDRNPSATFYLLPTRAWELGLGALAALAVRRGLVRPAPLVAPRLACAAVLLVVPLLWDEAGHPGLAALVCCLATAVLVIPGAPLAKDRGPLCPLRAIGDRSYSLYLLHWPLLVVATHLYLGPPPAWTIAALVGLCFVLAELQYRFVEQPFRTMRIDRRALALLVAIPLVTVAASLAASRALTTPVTLARGGGEGLSAACDFRGGFAPIAPCRTAAAPRTLVWGDSFAMALAPGMAASSPGGIVQATRTVCGPFVGVAPVNGALYPRGWAESCIAFNASVIDYVARTPSIRTVVLTSSMAQYVPGAEALGWRALVRIPAGFEERPQSLEALLGGVAATADAVRALGRRVVFVAPPPTDNLDSARCHDRRTGGRPVIGAAPDCSFGLADYRRARAPILAALDAMRRQGAVPVLSMDDALCAGGRCRTSIAGTVLYRDAGHLSTPGSRLLGERLRLGAAAEAMAR